ncbi:MAG: ABC transporter ATP-binding protein [Ruminococcaceae bacterium]|nr:ABC transporter ATP-binding protein [Oscillospiraceae bacterium]
MKLEINSIKKSYKKNQVLRGASLEAVSGESIGILGKNGSGKSTLFSVLCGLVKGEGEFLLDSRDLMKSPKERAAAVGFITQEPPLFPELSAKDNLLLWYSADRIKKSLEGGVLSMLGIGEFLKVPVSKMSGGMKKRLAIGCAVARDPCVLLLDEPSGALDIVCRQRIGEYLAAFRAAGGITVTATHDVHELSSCNKLYVLKDGTLTLHNGERDTKTLAELLL